MWYRVFGTNETQPTPETIQAQLDSIRPGSACHFNKDAADWFQAKVVLTDMSPIQVERFFAGEEGVRAELNSWAAYLETCEDSPHSVELMEHMIRTKQLFTIRKPLDVPNEAEVERVCLSLARFFARLTEGVYQIDEQGFFNPVGKLLLQEG